MRLRLSKHQEELEMVDLFLCACGCVCFGYTRVFVYVMLTLACHLTWVSNYPNWYILLPSVSISIRNSLTNGILHGYSRLHLVTDYQVVDHMGIRAARNSITRTGLRLSLRGYGCQSSVVSRYISRHFTDDWCRHDVIHEYCLIISIELE